ncbi:MAG: Crp/Fnr family transcriptional regulator [Clostridia bacterium]|nr:Crp/Fnr family transcriptional regulator [Clostridia bacterium]
MTTSDYGILSTCPLFADLNEEDLRLMLGCLGSRTARYPKGAAVFLEGDAAEYVGIVLEGAVTIVQDDFFGNRNLIGTALPGELFAEAFSCAGLERLPVSVFAERDTAVLLLDCRRVLQVCSSGCPFHHRLIANLLAVVSRKNLALNRKIRFVSQRTTREKLMSYLLDQAKQQGSDHFEIPFDRQALADFLAVERSAMSAEISRLRKEGVLESKGSWFRLVEVDRE